MDYLREYLAAVHSRFRLPQDEATPIGQGALEAAQVHGPHPRHEEKQTDFVRISLSNGPRSGRSRRNKKQKRKRRNRLFAVVLRGRQIVDETGLVEVVVGAHRLVLGGGHVRRHVRLLPPRRNQTKRRHPEGSVKKERTIWPATR